MLLFNCNKTNCNNLLKLLIFLHLLEWSVAIPRPFSCMSYMEFSLDDDNTLDDYNTALPTFTSTAEAGDKYLEADSSNEEYATHNVPFKRSCELDYTFCFALWRQTENGTHIEKQGCWKESQERSAICSRLECTSSAPTSHNTSLYYCCCSGDLCNQHMNVVEASPLWLVKDVLDTSAVIHSDNHEPAANAYFLTSYFLLVISVVLLGVFTAYYYCQRNQSKQIPEEAPLSPAGPGYSSNLRNVDNINLICLLDSGKYGTVMKGMLHDQEVAVKIFAEHNYDYYFNERNIYSLPLMNNPAFLNYFGYDERRTLDGNREYHLVLSLAPLGCLQDYLTANTLSFENLCLMLKSITSGLSFLHTELRKADEYKPCIAHRDFNTRNILVREDLSCSIADFGFALKVRGSRYEYKGEQALAETKSINEVGTLRYMAPELLDGAVNLRDCESSLKSVDVYALGLVLWEVVTRCHDLYKLGHAVPEYMSPFQQEVGLHPSFDQMHALVVRHKARPLFPVGWGSVSTANACKLIRETCEDCWDHDAEARLTSMCAEERMQEISLLRQHAPTASPILKANNFTSSIQHNAITAQDALQVTTKLTAQTDVDDNAYLRTQSNRQLYPNVVVVNGHIQQNMETMTEKNHQMQQQQNCQQALMLADKQQLQPYQGRNPCQERNLAPVMPKKSPVLVERSKKHSFQIAGQGNSLSCLEHDVCVEELLTTATHAKKIGLSNERGISIMGKGFPKQQNYDKDLRGWHGVRALIQKKLFRNDNTFNNVATTTDGGFAITDEKSNLMHRDNTTITACAHRNKQQQQYDFNNCEEIRTQNKIAFDGLCLRSTTTHKRPNNLDLSPLEHNQQQRSTQSCTDTPLQAHLMPNNLQKLNNNNKQYKAEENSNNNEELLTFRRQHSLEMFQELFSQQRVNGLEKLRKPSQRVKTPGDVPASVRKIRACKALSLYDDRMMDSSTLNGL